MVFRLSWSLLRKQTCPFFDYDNNNDYRLLITCKNKRIYNYTIKGKKVKGWKHNRGSDPTIHQFNT